MSVDVKTGKSVPYPNVDIEQLKPPVVIPGAVNVTLSPDKQWVAYTKKDNNLYVWNMADNKETGAHSDGSDHFKWLCVVGIL